MAIERSWFQAGIFITLVLALAACGESDDPPSDGEFQGQGATSLADSDMLSECGLVGWRGSSGELTLYPIQKIGVESDFPERFAPSVPLAEDSVSEFCVKLRGSSGASHDDAAVIGSSNDESVVAYDGFSEDRLTLAANGVGAATLTVTVEGVTDTWEVATQSVEGWNVELIEEGSFSARASESICGGQGTVDAAFDEGVVMGTPLHIIHYARSVSGDRLLGFRGEGRVAVEEYAAGSLSSIMSGIPKDGWYNLVVAVTDGGGSNYTPPDEIVLTSQTLPIGLAPSYGLVPRPDALGAYIRGRDGTSASCSIFPSFGGPRCLYTPDDGRFGPVADATDAFNIELVPAHGQTCLAEMAGCEYEVDIEVSELGSADAEAAVFDRCLEGGFARCETGSCSVAVSERFELEIPPGSHADLTVRNRAVIPALTNESRPEYYDEVERSIIIETR